MRVYIGCCCISIRASFRNEYGEEMAHIFALRLRRGRTRPRGLSRCGSRPSLELIGNAAAAHWDILAPGSAATRAARWRERPASR